MANFIEYASLAQDELNKEKQVVAGLASEVSLREAAVTKRSEELDKREAEIATKEKVQADTQVMLDLWKGKMRREEDVQKMFDDANAKLVTIENRLKETVQKNLDNGQQLEELKQQSLRLSEERKNYKEEVKKEVMQSVFGVK